MFHISKKYFFHLEKLWDDDERQEVHFITRNPFPWNKITVPHISLAEDKVSESPNSKVFKGFVIVLASIVAITIFYYCRKFCQCQKACSSAPPPTNSPKSRRNLRNAVQNSRINPDYVIRYYRGYQRMASQRSPHSPRRHTRRNIQVHSNKKESNPTSNSSEKPPEYSTVVLNEFSREHVELPGFASEISPETPPPKYEENNTFI